MRSRRNQEEPENHERWMVSYADFITLMFAFFTILYATSEHNAEKTKQFQQSLMQYLMKFGSMGESGQKINQGVEQNSPIESPLKVFPKGSDVTQKEQHKIENFLQSKLSSSQLERLIRDIAPDTFGVRITLSGDELFDRGSVNMKAGALKILDSIAIAVKSAHRRIIVEGHSDDKPQSSDLYPTVWELSSVRAARVLRYFNKIHKIDSSQMATMAFGDQRPLPPYNNRIDLLVITEDMPY